jgi:hypothetical protein
VCYFTVEWNKWIWQWYVVQSYLELLFITHYIPLFLLVYVYSKFFMFCWPCISIYACNEINLMHYLSSVYSVTIPLHVSCLLVAHHKEVTMYTYNKWYVMYVLVDCQLVWFQSGQLTVNQLLNIYIITSWWWATSKPETCRGIMTE